MSATHLDERVKTTGLAEMDMLDGCESLRILVGEDASEAVRNFAGIARCLGVSAEVVRIGRNGPRGDKLMSELASKSCAVLIDVNSVGRVIPSQEIPALFSAGGSILAKVFLLVTSAEPAVSEWMAAFTRGRVSGVRDAGNPTRVSFPAASRPFTAQLAGESFQRSTRKALGMVSSGDREISMLAGFDGEVGSFLRVADGASEVFVWSTPEVFDMERLLERELEFESAMDEFIPAIIFLRHVFGARCWHTPTIRAEIVIDDPLLVPKYGCIDFPDLLREAESRGFHVTVAFIPWNHWRTSPRIAAGFQKSGAHFGICAHGYDHSGDEFLSSDDAGLLERCHLAGERMDEHRDRTGMQWERVMVCPREDYSMSGLGAICESGRFLAIANSSCIPRRLTAPQVRGADLLVPAQDALFGFPIFKRHYWTSISAFALSTFLGKPAILSEHHGVCRDGQRALNEYVSGIETMCPGVQWSNVGEIAVRTCLHRRVSPSVLEVRFFAEEFEMMNPGSSALTVRFQKRIPEGIAVPSVLVDGTSVPFTREAGLVAFESLIAAGESISVKVCRRRSPRPVGHHRGVLDDVRTCARRFASELRDRFFAWGTR